VQFSRLAVEADARRQGIAGELLRAADAESRARGARRIVLHAQTYAIELYARDGYEARGRRFVEAGIEHVAMEKRLA
jgi:predicted GNAT family N-acyltransferase